MGGEGKVGREREGRGGGMKEKGRIEGDKKWPT